MTVKHAKMQYMEMYEGNMQPMDATQDLILDALRGGHTLITVNNRLALHWRRRYDERQAREAAIWPAADILPWSAWLRRVWDEASWLDEDAPLLLDAHQSALIWQEIIEGDGLPLLQPRATARLAQEAWKLMQDWCIEGLFDPLEAHDDALHFQRWAQRFNARCQREGWLDEARLPACIIQALDAGRIEPPSPILLLGFDELRPVQRALLDSLRARGTEVQLLQPTPGAKAKMQRAGRYAFADAACENEAAVRWARGVLDCQPHARIALIAPDLGARRAGLTRLLDAQLAPQTLLPAAEDGPRPWNISLGTALRDTGMVRAALLAFELGDACLPLETLSLALVQPFFTAYADERDARALLDARLRARGERHIATNVVRRLAMESGCPSFAQMLKRLREQRHDEPRRQSPAVWAEVLRESLQHVGWPGDATLDSAGYQLRQAWLDLLNSLARLEPVRPSMSRHEALGHVRALASETLFQPEAVANAPVQVLGPLEAVGLEFDAIWLMGMHDGQWPQEARPNPFLPIRLQARKGMPHASPARELDYARRISVRLLELAPEVVVSHPIQESGLELATSPLFTHLPEYETPPQGSALPMPDAWGTRAKLEPLPDVSVPLAGEGDVCVRGGARVLELQSACPFRAFAELRLGAQTLEEPGLGPDARTRGTLLHVLMERIWGALGDHKTLEALCRGEHACGEGSLEALVRRHALATVEEEARHHHALWPERLQALEVERLSKLAVEWLQEHERKRPAFTVEVRESRRLVEIGGLRLNVKLDRVDRLDEGGFVVIDYKSGSTSIADWAGERPAAPQLPLYAVSGEDVRGIAFAQLRAGELALKGQGDSVQGLTTPKPSWAEALAEYRRVLEMLAQDFRAGHAAVDPRNSDVCSHCPLGMLCRIHELAGPDRALEEV